MAIVRKREWTYKGEAKTAWIVDYTDQGGKRRQKTFDKKKEADAARIKIEIEIEKGAHTPDSQSKAIADLCEEYIRYSELRIRDGRIGIQRQRSIIMGVTHSIKPHIGALKSNSLTENRVEEFYKQMLEDGLKPKSARYRLQMLKQIMEYAIKRGYAAVNPVPGAIRELRGFVEPTIRTFTPEEVRRILAIVDARRKGQHHQTHMLIKIMIHVAAFCGLRYGEILGLRAEDVDIEARMIHVRKNLTRFDGLKGPKTRAGIRDVPMPVHVADMMRVWMSDFYAPNDLGVMLRGRNGSNMTSGAFHVWHWKKVLKDAGLLDDGGERPHFHALRHFAASHMISIGMPVTDVAQILGHSKFDMTLQTYAHPIVKTSVRRDMIDRMSGEILSLQAA